MENQKRGSGSIWLKGTEPYLPSPIGYRPALNSYIQQRLPIFLSSQSVLLNKQTLCRRQGWATHQRLFNMWLPTCSLKQIKKISTLSFILHSPSIWLKIIKSVADEIYVRYLITQHNIIIIKFLECWNRIILSRCSEIRRKSKRGKIVS